MALFNFDYKDKPMASPAKFAGRLFVNVLVALVMGIKVRIVCDRFLELPTARRGIRLAMHGFCYGMPVLVILTSAFGDTLARLTGALI